MGSVASKLYLLLTGKRRQSDTTEDHIVKIYFFLIAHTQLIDIGNYKLQG